MNSSESLKPTEMISDTKKHDQLQMVMTAEDIGKAIASYMLARHLNVLKIDYNVGHTLINATVTVTE